MYGFQKNSPKSAIFFFSFCTKGNATLIMDFFFQKRASKATTHSGSQHTETSFQIPNVVFFFSSVLIPLLFAILSSRTVENGLVKCLRSMQHPFLENVFYLFNSFLFRQHPSHHIVLVNVFMNATEKYNDISTFQIVLVKINTSKKQY